MAIEHILGTYPALKCGDTSLATKQFYAVQYATTAGQIAVCSAVDQTAIGVLQNKPAAGEHATVAYLGITKAVAGTSLGWGKGVSVGFDTTGKIVPRTTAVATFPWPKTVGMYVKLESSVAKNDLVSVMLNIGTFPDN